MSIDWNRGAEPSEALIADRFLYLDKSGERLVEEGSAESASLLVGKGLPVPAADVARLRLELVEGKVAQRVADPVAETKDRDQEDERTETTADTSGTDEETRG